jgi:hypothetical protein
LLSKPHFQYLRSSSWVERFFSFEISLFQKFTNLNFIHIQLTLVISNSMGPWEKFESTVVRLKRSYEDTGSVVCLTTKGRQLEQILKS